MPKLTSSFNPDREFLADFERKMDAHNRRANARQVDAIKATGEAYWKEQRRKMNDPKARSYDALTEWVA